ncbi:MAG: hypothetical protein AB7V50_03770 [Vampirovibrionia bacterium]
MQTTFSPVTFNGGLRADLDKAKSTLDTKKAQLGALEGSAGEFKLARQDKTDTFTQLTEKADQTVAKGANLARTQKSEANKNLVQSAIQSMKDNKASTEEAIDTFKEAQKRIDSLLSKMDDLADDTDRLKTEAQSNLKEINDTAKPLNKALAQLLKADLQESNEADVQVNEAKKAALEAKETLTKSLAAIEKLAKKEEATIADLAADSAFISQERGETKSASKKENRQKLLSDLTSIRRQQIDAFKAAIDTCRAKKQTISASIQEYQDQAGADYKKAADVQKDLRQLDRTVTKLKVLSFIASSKNLAPIAEEMVGLGKFGEGATPAVVTRIVNSLSASKLFSSVAGKIGAAEAAEVVIRKGSDNQRTAMTSSIKLKSSPIVENANSLEVLNALDKLDKAEDEVAAQKAAQE